MPRFFISPSAVNGKTACIEGEDVSHIGRVLRMRTGDEITLCDGSCNDYFCIISEITKNQIICNIIKEEKNTAEPSCRITLFQGVPKGSKMDIIVQKCVEAGVFEIIPVMTKRVVAKGDIKAERLNKISEEAAKQAGRGIIPKVRDAVTFDEAIRMAGNFDLAIIPYEEEREISLKSILRGKTPGNVAVIIGPEGGFEQSEVAQAISSGLCSVTLGKRILRTETAGLAVISNITYEYEF